MSADRTDEGIRTVPPEDTEPNIPDAEEVEPDTAEGPPPSQDNPVAPGGTIPPRG